MGTISTIGFDADDTLWESEIYFAETEGKFLSLMQSYGVEVDVHNDLYSTEKKNLTRFGYGVKSFTISMIESAHYLTGGTLRSDDTLQIVEWGKELMNHPLELLAGVKETLQTLNKEFCLLIITKGDLFHQQQKITDSGLEVHTNGVEILQEKDSNSYQKLLSRREIEPEDFLMVGNSLRSDVLPVLNIGGHAIHIPHEVTWQYENEFSEVKVGDGYSVLESITEVPEFLSSYNSQDLK